MKRGKSKPLRTKLTLCLLFICLVLSVPSVRAEEIIIGTGTSTWGLPLNTFWHDARTQTIYLASEIGAPYNITALALYVTQVPGQTMNNFTIRMKHTDMNVYGSSPNWESSDWTTVYQTNETVTATGWVQFNFSTPFEYNDGQNLMVDISFNNSSYTTTGFCRYSTPGGTRTICYYTDSGYGDPLNWYDRTPIPNTTTSVPNVKLIVESSTKVAKPVFTPDGGVYNSEQNVVITCATAGATIHYTTNGFDPTESDPVIASGSSIPVNHSLTLKAKAWKSGLDPSSIKSADYQLVVATPVFTPDGGFYQSEQDVVITCMTSGATIHYTTDGNDPTESDPTIASGDSVLVSVDPSTTLKARAWKTGLEPSNIKEAIYLYNPINNYSMEGSFIYQDPLGSVAEYWTGWRGDYGYFSEGSYAHDGSKSQEIAWNGYGYESFGPSGIYQQVGSLERGQIYRLSAWFKFQFVPQGSGGWSEGNITCSVGTDPDGGTNPDVVTNWNSVSDYAYGWYEPPWLNVVTYFSATGPAATIFIKAEGYGDAEEEDPPMPAPWYAHCYIDDVVVHQIEGIDPASSTVEATSPVPANGASYSEVTITVLDPCSNPIEGVPPSEIDVNCTGSGNVILGPDGPTDVNGQTTAKFVSYVAETKTVSATVLETVLSDTATVHFCESNHKKFRASNGAADDNFGYSVAIDGNTALVGAIGDDNNGNGSGSAYIFRFDGSNWFEEAKLLASDGASSDYFGWSVAIDGNTALIGAYEDDDKGGNSGSAYIFRFNGSSWVQQAKLLASDGAAQDYFGISVAIDGNTALVGAEGDDDKGSYSGSAYIFRFNGSSWIQQAKLLAPDGAAYDHFGISVAIDGNTALVGAYEDDDKGSESGSAYVFRFNGSTWVQEAKLLASDGAAYDWFGQSVDIDGNTALVGAKYDDDKGNASGSAYIFRFNGSNWVEEAKLLAPDSEAYDYFSYSVAINGNTALVGAYGDNDNGSHSGSAYIFRFNGSSWVQENKLLAPDGAAYDYFGYSVAIDGITALVGAIWDDDKGGNSGSAYVFPTTIPGDLDGDGLVNFFDYGLLADQWLGLPGQPSADVAPCGGDCLIDQQDLKILCEHWLEEY